MTNKGIVFPELIFSKWYQWENRSRIFNLKNPSTYTISLSPLNLDEKRFSCNDVAYIGMTNSVKGLNGRLKQFDRSI